MEKEEQGGTGNILIGLPDDSLFVGNDHLIPNTVKVEIFALH